MADRPRRSGTADPGSDPAWEWGLCWLCGHTTNPNEHCGTHCWTTNN